MNINNLYFCRVMSECNLKKQKTHTHKLLYCLDRKWTVVGACGKCSEHY